jgi:hypothetical protein
MADSIMDWVNNTESLYNDLQGLYQEWYRRGEAFRVKEARKEAAALARHFAEFLGTHSEAAISAAGREIFQDFKEYKRYREESLLKKQNTETQEAARDKKAAATMTPEELAHYRKYEDVARKIGIDHILRDLIPVTPERIRKALLRGDLHLNSIPLSLWDQAAEQIPYAALVTSHVGELSLAQKVCVLKHVAAWHYA